jgi:hypothetical protein
MLNEMYVIVKKRQCRSSVDLKLYSQGDILGTEAHIRSVNLSLAPNLLHLLSSYGNFDNGFIFL